MNILFNFVHDLDDLMGHFTSSPGILKKSINDATLNFTSIKTRRTMLQIMKNISNRIIIHTAAENITYLYYLYFKNKNTFNTLHVIALFWFFKHSRVFEKC